MTADEFADLIRGLDAPVVLVEGTRAVPERDLPRLTAFAARLARNHPSLRFRTGNAKGSDRAFAEGVASVDASRLEFVLPYAGHRRRGRPEQASAVALDDVTVEQLDDVVRSTIAATPRHKSLAMGYRNKVLHPRQRAIAQMLLRDALKVIGAPRLGRPVAGIFYVNAEDPEKGGTGHTIRVCRGEGVPVVTQAQWMAWEA